MGERGSPATDSQTKIQGEKKEKKKARAHLPTQTGDQLEEIRYGTRPPSRSSKQAGSHDEALQYAPSGVDARGVSEGLCK